MKSYRSLRFLLLAAVIPLLFVACTERRQMSLLEKAEGALSESHYLEATELLRRAILIDPDSKPGVKAYYRLGFVQETYLQDFEGALLSYLEFVKYSSDQVSVYEVLKRIANIYFQHVLDLDKAVETYQKLLSLSPDSLEADFFLFQSAQAYFRLNKFELARTQYQTLTEKFPKSQYAARARYAVGNSYFMEGRYDVALEALKQVLRQHEDSDYAIEARFLMAQCLEHQQKYQNALEIYRSLQNRYPVPAVLELRMKELAKRVKEKK